MSEWELSKENIQPLQKGRKTNMLRASLADQPADSRLEKRRFFESQLRVYEGDDPLSIWCEYINWLEQNYPKGGKDGDIGKLINQCLIILKDDIRYQNDARFIDIWLKFANMTTNPREVYSNMHSHNIGCLSAHFYLAWAWECEQRGDFKQADDILMEGIHRNAQPLESLKFEHSQLEVRMSVAFASGVGPPSENQGQSDHRSAFSVLKSQGKNKAPISRVAPMAQPARKESLTIGFTQPQPKKNTSTKLPFSIYNTDDRSPKESSSGNGGGSLFMLQTDGQKENEKKPTKWNKVKAQSAAMKPKMPDFVVHKDDAPQPCSAKKNLADSKVLTTLKVPPRPAMALFEPADPMKRPMYDRSKVYGGTEEFSFEEIHAAIWHKRERKLKEEQERLMEKQEMAKMREQMKWMQEQLVFLMSKANNKAPQGMSDGQASEIMDKLTSMQQHFSVADIQQQQCASVDPLQKTENQPIVEKTATQIPKVDPSLGDMRKFAIKESSHEVGTHSNEKIFRPKGLKVTKQSGGTENVIEQMMGNWYDSGMATSSLKDCFDPQLRAAKENCNVREGANTVGKSCSKSNLALRSALPEERSVDLVASEKQTDSSHHEQLKMPMPIKQASIPFSIFEDSATSRQAAPIGKCREEIAADCQIETDENMVPPEYVQARESRELVGILQPSKNIAFIPLEQQEQEEDESDDEVLAKPLEDFTMIAPMNTQHFAFHAQFVSTPLAKPVFSRQPEVEEASSNATTGCTQRDQLLRDMHDIIKINKCSRIDDIVRAAIENISMEETNDTSFRRAYYNLQSCLGLTDDATLRSMLKHAMLQIEGLLGNKSAMFGNSRSWPLSTIMENSKESSSKSSSSSSNSVSSIPRSKSLMSTVMEKSQEISNSAMTSKDLGNDCSLSFAAGEINPFDRKLTDRLLQGLRPPITSRSNYSTMASYPDIKVGQLLNAGPLRLFIENHLAEGAYAKIYKATTYAESFDSYLSNDIAVKVCKNANAWEFYVCSVVHDRLATQSNKTDVSESVMKVINAIGVRKGIILLSELCPYGSLLEVVNIYKQKGSQMPECLVLYFALEMLMIMSRIHECGILHGDIKPDNFVLKAIPKKLDLDNIFRKTNCLRLIDFGRAVDLNLLPPKTTFNVVVTTDSFKCSEMIEGKPWVHQADWFGILGTIHVLLFGEYMTVKRDKNGKWQPTLKFRRYWQADIWEPMFSTFLNMPGCYEVPDIWPFANAISAALAKQKVNFVKKCTELHQVMNKS